MINIGKYIKRQREIQQNILRRQREIQQNIPRQQQEIQTLRQTLTDEQDKILNLYKNLLDDKTLQSIAQIIQTQDKSAANQTTNNKCRVVFIDFLLSDLLSMGISIGIAFFSLSQKSNLNNFWICLLVISIGLGGVATATTNFIFDATRSLFSDDPPERRGPVKWLTTLITGIFERAFFFTAVAFQQPGVMGAMITWIALKAVNTWSRFMQGDKNDKSERQNMAIRLNHAALSNLTSLGFALIGGLAYENTAIRNFMLGIFP